MEVVEISEKEFSEFAMSAACDGCRNFIQSVEMRQRYLANGTECYLVGLRRGGALVAAALMAAGVRKIGGQKIFKVAGGPLMDYEADGAEGVLAEFARGLASFAKAHGGMAVRICPDVAAEERDGANAVVEGGSQHKWIGEMLGAMGWKYLGEYEQAKWTYVVPVAGVSEDELWLAIRKSHRQRIRKAEKAGVRVRELAEDELDVFEKLEGEAAERHQFAGPSAKYYQEMLAAFGPEHCKFMVSEVPDGGEMKPAAVGMFVLWGREILCVYSGTAREFNKSGAAHLLRWEMIKRAREGGFARYNFYGTHPLPNDGVYEFKRGFGGHVEELVGSFILPTSLLGRIYCARLKTREYSELQ